MSDLDSIRFSWNILIKGVTAESIHFNSNNVVKLDAGAEFLQNGLSWRYSNEMMSEWTFTIGYRHHFFNFQLQYKFEEPLFNLKLNFMVSSTHNMKILLSLNNLSLFFVLPSTLKDCKSIIFVYLITSHFIFFALFSTSA